MSSEDIEQGVPVGSIQAAIGCRIAIMGVQPPDQLGVLLDNDPQSEV
jgi:hypothetical protein